MDGWHIGVLIAIIVVFCVLVVLIFCLWHMRRWNWGIFSGAVQPRPFVPIFPTKSTTLYFRDSATHKLYSVDISGVRSADDLQRLIGVEVGRSDTASVALSRVDEGNVLVELDLNNFVSSSMFGEAVRRSAVEPLILSKRLLPHLSFALPASSFPTPRNLVPRVYIFPKDSLIRQTDPIVISASVFVDANTREPVNLSYAQCNVLELAFLERESKVVDLKEGGMHAKVNSNQEDATIGVPNGQNSERRIKRIKFNNLKYSFDNNTVPSVVGGLGGWVEYTSSFSLSLGRWCVRAQAYSDDGQMVIGSVSRVYTVQ